MKRAALYVVLGFIAGLYLGNACLAWATGTLTIPNVIGLQPAGQVAASLFDANWNQIRDYINNREITVDTCANRPAAGTKGRYYFCTDTSVNYVDTGTAWQQISSTPVYTTELASLTTFNAATNQILVAPGAAASDDATIANRVLMTLASGTQGNTAGTWVAGNFQNKLDAGTLGATQTWHVFEIQRIDTGNVDLLFSQSATAPTMPTNYTKKRRIASFRTDGGSNILAYTQLADEFLWKVPVNDFNAGNPGVAAVTRALTVPTGIQVVALYAIRLQDAAGARAITGLATALDTTDTAPSGTVLNFIVHDAAASGLSMETTQQTRTNTLAQIRTRIDTSDANVTITGTTWGWIDRRDR